MYSYLCMYVCKYACMHQASQLRWLPDGFRTNMVVLVYYKRTRIPCILPLTATCVAARPPGTPGSRRSAHIPPQLIFIHIHQLFRILYTLF